jgi:crotonobetainyl-CoA:carnitine CoA-transferase CaiB-like acyl-CoA transferase
MTEEGPLAGVHIVERAASLGATFAGFLLAGLGADVLKIEPRGTVDTPGDRVVQRGKRRIVLDPEASGAWASFVESADVVLTDEVVAEPEPRADAVHVRVTGWGRQGHPRGLPPAEALLAAASGAQALQWSWARRPVWLVTPVVSYMTGILAALGAASGVLACRRGIDGDRRIDASGIAAAFALNSGTLVTGRETRGSLSRFGDPRGQIPTYSLFRTADGWLFVGALTQPFLVKLMDVLGRLDLLADPHLQGNPLTFGVPDIRDFVRGELDPVLARRSTTEWLAAMRAADLPCGRVQSHEEALRDPEAREVGVVVPVDDPLLGRTWQPAAPATFSDTPAPVPRAAARPGADTAPPAAPRPARAARAGGPRRALDGVRVLDLASFIAGPFCPLLLADLGADVVKIESPDGDPFRMTLFGFIGWNRGKRSLVLDLKRAEGRDVFLDLARGADVVVDNFRAGVMERLGIGWETLCAANSRLVHTSISGYGSSGPLARLPAFDPVFQARSGLAHVQGGGVEPVMHMIAYNDYCAGALGALATVAALVARERTGRGQRVDVSLFRTSYVAQAAAMILHAGPRPPALGGRDYLGPSAARRLYPCADGWLCVDATTPAARAAFARFADVDLDADDAAGTIERRLAASTCEQAAEQLTDAGVPAEPCRGFDEVLADPWLRASGLIGEQEHVALGPLVLTGPFVRSESTPPTLGRSAPLLGAQGVEVLTELGYPAERIDALLAAGVVGRPA